MTKKSQFIVKVWGGAGTRKLSSHTDSAKATRVVKTYIYPQPSRQMTDISFLPLKEQFYGLNIPSSSSMMVLKQ